MIFFFQAEDGIRDLYVTGVQTCALPISRVCSRKRPSTERTRMLSETPGMPGLRQLMPRTMRSIFTPAMPARYSARSEERRVGKECGTRRRPRSWTTLHAGIEELVVLMVI